MKENNMPKLEVHLYCRGRLFAQLDVVISVRFRFLTTASLNRKPEIDWWLHGCHFWNWLWRLNSVACGSIWM